MKPTALLLTGVPGVGKTTVIRRVAEAHSGLSAKVKGFFTSEMRQDGRRVGFRITSLEGRDAILAHVDLTAAYRVGHYGVDVSALDDIVAHTLTVDAGLYLIDEIGKMECFSVRFTRAVTDLLDLRCPMVASIGLKGGGFMSQVKGRPDVEIWTVTQENRDAMPAEVIKWLG